MSDSGLLLDGLDSNCSTTGAFWTYNQARRRRALCGRNDCHHYARLFVQGIFVRFASEMYLQTHEDTFLADAQVSAEYVIAAAIACDAVSFCRRASQKTAMASISFFSDGTPQVRSFGCAVVCELHLFVTEFL